MDPFTEKLLERTRARRENLQRKMAERPTAANRQMAKRSREPLTETNSAVSQPATEKVLPSSKPSPSKRRCSEEKACLTGEENKEPVALHATALELKTDKKPPICPSSNHSTTSERMPVDYGCDSGILPPCATSDTEMVTASLHAAAGGMDSVMKFSIQEGNKEIVQDATAPIQTESNMKSRLQRLAVQRQCWDSEGRSEPVPDSISLSPLKSQKMEVATHSALTSETRLGRKGRLANLAATISSWEDDLGHPPTCIDNAQGQPGTACVPLPAHVHMSSKARPGAAAQPTSIQSTKQLPVSSPVKSSRVTPSGSQKIVVPETKLDKGAGPIRSYSSQNSTPLKSEKVPSTPNPAQSPLKTPCKDLKTGKIVNSSLIKTNVTTKPSCTIVSAFQANEKFTNSTPSKHGVPVGNAGVKSFVERFGERCQERKQESPLGSMSQGHKPAVTPSSLQRTRLLQERLVVTQGNSSTAVLTQKQKMEREAELALVRNRFQKGKLCKSKGDPTEANLESKAMEDVGESSASILDKPPTPILKISETPTLSESEMSSLKPYPSSPLKNVGQLLEKEEQQAKETEEEWYESERREKEVEEEVHEVERNVDGSINSEVINDLFEGVLDENEECGGEEDEEEDALNISSMSLLTPLTETVAAVVKSPERKVMTSTPASSFTEKSGTLKDVSRPSKFQRTQMPCAGSSNNKDEDQRLPYSIDAYRSTRVKDTERPQIKQVIVRKEDVSKRMEKPRNPCHISIKQKMQDLTNEINLQQTVIHQASQALNCCTDEEHGKGTQVEAEAERLLLIATERRVALKAELDQLKAQGPSAHKVQEDLGVTASRGSITLQEFRLPLKADFVCSSTNRPESGNHYFFVIIRAGAENMVATPLASIHSALGGDALTFSTKFTLPDVSSDFEIDIEVYYLVQKRELFGDKRKKPMKSKAITPKRFLAISKSSVQTPVMASPGGPNAVRTSNFALVGSHKLTLASIGKNRFQLEKMKYEGIESKLLSDMFQKKVPFLCPLEGHIYLKLQCEVDSRVEERGFLTMFEDVSGYGAWHRRWCVLSGYCISYWTYPDDEKQKNPIGRIGLASCTSHKVEPANREFCARPNTFELITVRPQREDDKETLVSQCMNTMCVTKNWLSADTKEERNLWMRKLNQILVDLRMWQPDSCYRPV